MKTTGLAARLLFFGLLSALAVAIAGGFALRESVRNVLQSSFERRIQERTDEIAARLYVAKNGLSYDRSITANSDFSRIYSGWYWQADLTPDAPATMAQRQLRSRSLWDAELAPPPARAVPEETMLRLSGPRGEPLLGHTRNLSGNDIAFVLRVFGPEAEIHALLQRFDYLLVTAICGWLLLMAVLTFAQVRVGLRPLAHLRKNVEALTTGDKERVGTGFGADLDPLAREIDQMLERNEHIVHRGRTHTADLAHALKKPLSLLNAEAARLPPDASALIVEQTQSMTRMIERHLARAGSGAGNLRRVDVRACAQEMLDLIARIHADRGLAWELDCPEAYSIRANQADIEEMLGNLLDNAGKWAASRVRLRIRQQGNRLSLCIEDDGAGLDEQQRQEAGSRGRRFDESREGSGLGLAIVADIAETYSGSLRLETSAWGGLAAILELPPMGGEATSDAPERPPGKAVR